jgi:hypothetical protein
MFQIGLLLSIGVFIAYGLANQYWELIPIQLVLAFAYSSMFVGALSYLLKRHPEYGTTSGLMNSVNALAGVFSDPYRGRGFPVLELRYIDVRRGRYNLDWFSHGTRSKAA